MSSSTRLDLWDYVTLIIIVLAASVIGLYHTFKARNVINMREFLISSHELGIFPLILSIVATVISAVNLMGFPVEAYMNGVVFAYILICNFVAAFVVTKFYLPVFYRLKGNTIFEYLELRFSKTVKMCTTSTMAVQALLYASVAIYGPALALNQVTGLHLWASVASITIICTIYTSLGGFKAVVWADVTQVIVIAIVMIMVIVKATIDVGGLNNVWDKLKVGNRLQHWGSESNLQFSIWTILFGLTTAQLSFYTINQSLIQRCLSCKTLKKSQITLISGMFGISCFHVIVVIVGLIMYAYYFDCDPLLNGDIKYRDQLMPWFATHILSFCKGLSGVFVAGLMCGTLSTLSSFINSLTVITISDYVKIFKPEITDKTSIRLSRLLVVIYGGLCMAIVRLAENMGGIASAIFAIVGLTSGPVFTVFTMGMLLPWVNSKGALSGFLCSLVIPLWAWLGKMLTTPALPSPSLNTNGCTNYSITNINTPLLNVHEKGTFYPFCSICVGLVVALIASKITGFSQLSEADPDLFFTFIRKYIVRAKKTKELQSPLETVQPLLIVKYDSSK